MAEEWKVTGQPGLNMEFKACLRYIMRTCLKKDRKLVKR
jgi:hypothetical protein